MKVSYVPSLKYHTKNSVTGKFEMKEFYGHSSINKAYEYMAKEHLYALMDINETEKISGL